MTDSWQELVHSTEYAKQAFLPEFEANSLVGFLKSLTEEELQKLLSLSQEQKLVDTVVASL